jgi:hypothetical protein
MELEKRIKRHENLHIVFWLIKDSCWMLEFRWLGIAMVIPTLIIAGTIAYISRKTDDLYINLSIFFWISANSYWMFIEFFTTGEYKFLAVYPFALGFVFVGLYYYITLITKPRSI